MKEAIFNEEEPCTICGGSGECSIPALVEQGEITDEATVPCVCQKHGTDEL